MNPNNNSTKVPIIADKIAIICIGGAGCNIANDLDKEVPIRTFAINTDKQSLENSTLPDSNKILLRRKDMEEGIGAGADPEVATEAAEAELENIIRTVGPVDMVFVICGMGKGTGSGASHVIAKGFKDMGVLVIAIITKPFVHEGNRIMHNAENAIEILKSVVDSIIVIPNQNVFGYSTSHTDFKNSIRFINSILVGGIIHIVNLIIKPGTMNLDFADVCTVLRNQGHAILGFAKSNQIDREQIELLKTVLSHPLMDDEYTVRGAQTALLHIVGGSNMSLYEVRDISMEVQNRIGNSDCCIISGTSVLEDIDPNEISILFIAAGLKKNAAANRVLEAKLLDNGQLSLEADHKVENSTVKQGWFSRIFGFGSKKSSTPIDEEYDDM